MAGQPPNDIQRPSPASRWPRVRAGNPSGVRPGTGARRRGGPVKRSRGPSRVRVQPYVPTELAKRLEAHCAATGVTESAGVTAALEQWLDGTSDKTLLLRRLDRLGRAIERVHRDEEFLSEAFSVFVRIWFAHTPNVPEDGRRVARASAEGRYGQFVQHVVQQFSGGRRFVDDLPQEPIANDGELDSLRAEPENPPMGEAAQDRSRPAESAPAEARDVTSRQRAL